MYTSTLAGEFAAINREHDLRMAQKLMEDLPAPTVEALAADPLSVIHMYLGILDKGMELGFYQPGTRDDQVIEQMHQAALGYLEARFPH